MKGKREPRQSVLDGSTDPNASEVEKADYKRVLKMIAERGPREYEYEMQVRQIRAYESASYESAATGDKLVVLTYVLVALTIVLVALTIVVAVR